MSWNPPIARPAASSGSEPETTRPGICIDGHNLSLARGTGIATYGRHLLSSLSAAGSPGDVLYGTLTRRTGDDAQDAARIANMDQSDRIVGRATHFWRTAASGLGRIAHPVSASTDAVWPAGRRPEAHRYWLAPSLYRYGHRAFKKYAVTTPVRFRAAREAPKPAVMHWTSPLPIQAVGIPNVYTFHDLIPVSHPHLTTGDPRVYLELCRAVARSADLIAVVSETTRQEVIERLGVPEERVVNTYQAIHLPADLPTKEQTAQELEEAFDLDWKGYFLHFGAIEPKKNLGRIIEAYLASGVPTPLVLVGARAWMSEGETALLDAIRRDGDPAAQRIRQYDYLPKEALTSLVRGARAMLFPSLYEGFGLPVLESMAMGTAVLTSTAGSLPEISGGATLLVDAYDVSSMASSIRVLACDDDVIADLETKGLTRSMSFSPEAYHSRLGTLYGKVGFTLTA